MRRRIGQVIAPLFIIQRVANRSALTSETTVSGEVVLFKARDGGQSVDRLPGGDPTRLVNRRGVNPKELGVGAGITTDFHQNKV